jgi:hypothetical protein
MAFDQGTRNRLARFVGEARNLLTEEFTRQLQLEYGMDPTSGEVVDMDDKLAHLDDARRSTAQLLRETLAHYEVSIAERGAKARQEALDRIVREQAFTVLNRLCALRMAEARGLLIESVAKGYQSKGFQLYSRLAGTALGETGDAYRYYLFSLFDEFAVDLAVLFDRFSPQGRMFPREATLLELLDLINHLEIEALWSEDETIGWIYQYFNSKEERKAMRDASQAPRNSRELAVRNQFFTPRYVVEFLTDNTLGRTWYEMTQGATSLKDSCRYMVRRACEIFLAEGEVVPTPQQSETKEDEDLSQEDLLRQPVYIAYRPLKDPRNITMLDPACGSMHFGLYAFDLFERIYEEAWELEGERGPGALLRATTDVPLHESYADKEAFLRDVPRLIVECNIHGVDIDPRAVQIAGLSLWLRAQKTWRDLGLNPQERPQIRSSNVVCAESMPGDKGLLKEFIAGQLAATPEDQIIGEMLPAIFKAMELASEAGSLLKIEGEIIGVIEAARTRYEQALLQRQKEAAYLPGMAPVRDTSLFDLLELPRSEQFWPQAEERIYTALGDYARQAENGGGYRRRLFADDAVRGFAFIDLARKRYDVVLMNPPFGKYSDGSKDYFEFAYPSFKSDIGVAFVDRFLNRCTLDGCVGAITSRAFLASDSLEDWRIEYLLDRHPIHCLLDLGYGVLDDAMVEAAVYVVDASPRPKVRRPFIRALESRQKEFALRRFFDTYNSSGDVLLFEHKLEAFKEIPLAVICYWLPDALLRKIHDIPSLPKTGGAARHGLVTTDDFRFLRLVWEVPLEDPNGEQRSCWKLLAKGGEYQPFWDDLHICVDWTKDGDLLKTFLAEKRLRTQGSADWSPWLNHSEYYLLEGLTYPERTTSDFCPRILPKDVIFSSTGQAIQFSAERGRALAYLSGAFTRFFKLVVESFVGSGDNAFPGSAAKHYRSGLLNQLPAPLAEADETIMEIAERGVNFGRFLFAEDETSRYFCPGNRSVSLRATAFQRQAQLLSQATAVIRDNTVIEARVAERFLLTVEDLSVVSKIIGPHPHSYLPADVLPSREIAQLWSGKIPDVVESAIQLRGPRRQLTKKSYIADRKLELICHTLLIPPESVVLALAETGSLKPEFLEEAGTSEISLAVGSILGRWDIRYAIGERSAPPAPDPFAQLPVCPPGMLQNSYGLPAMPSDVPSSYPLRISWAGILVDESGHPEDIEHRVQEVLRVIWGEYAETVEQEVCKIVQARALREYFRKPAGFFTDHLAHYSKSRRQAPIYWPLSTPSGSYTLWIYYHRLTDQTLYTCVNDFVDPKLKQVAEQVAGLQRKNGRSAKEEKDLEQLSDLERELKDFRAELLRIAAFWMPNLNDGVQITAAPLWKLFQYKPWQKRLRETWASMESGEYDWAHLSYSIWPERVREKCRSDKSLAIAHGLEDLYVEVPTTAGKKGGRTKKGTVEMAEMEEVLDVH